jgi:hypothetical protein
MKHLITFLVCAAAVYAQPRLISSAPFAPVGSPAVVSLTLAGGGMNPAALQVDLPIPAGALIAPGPAIAGVKGLYFFVNSSNVLRIVVADGVGTIPDGVVATISFTALPFQFTPANALAVDPLGEFVTFTATGMSFGPSCDLTGDNKVDKADKDLAMEQLLGRSACVSADLDGDGKCLVRDLQRLISAINGGACRIGR